MRFHWSIPVRGFIIAIFLMGLAAASSSPGAAQTPIRSVVWDQPMRIPSPEESNSWFPDLAVDSKGNVHAVWCETLVLENQPMSESVYYSVWNGREWSQYVDIVAPSPDIRRNALAIDSNDTLHLLYGSTFESTAYRLTYKYAPSSQAYSTANWSQEYYLNEEGLSYMSDIAAYENRLVALYEDSGQKGSECSECADIYVRTSTDLGNTWSVPMSLNPTGQGDARPHLFVDKNGVVYASWDQGWDRLTDKGQSQFGIFMYSTNGGDTWTEPITISQPNSMNIQTTVSSNGDGGIMLVWRTTSDDYPGVYFMWTPDGGEHWMPPQSMPNFKAGSLINNFDTYDMAVDSAGHIHLLASGYLLADERNDETQLDEGPPGLYHFEWDGQRWFPPTLLYRGGWHPEYPHLVINRGNQLHATWFLRQKAFENTSPHVIMYAHGKSSSTELPGLSQVELVPTAETIESQLPFDSVPTAVPDSRPTATWVPGPLQPSSVLYTEVDDYVAILLSLVPVVLLIAAVAFAVRRRSP